MTPIIKRFVIKLLSKDQGSGITKLPGQMQAGFQESMVTEKLIRKGYDPKAIRSEEELKMILNRIDASATQSKEQKEKAMKQLATIMDMKGRKIKPGSRIMGGEEVVETEAEILERLKRGNKETVERIKERKLTESFDPDVEDAIDNASPGFANDIKYDAQLVADDLAEKRFGKEFYDLDQREQMKLYDEAYQGLSKNRFRNKPDPEDMATGGRAGFMAGGMGRRAFLKMMAAGGAGIAGLKTGLINLFKPRSQAVEQVVETVTKTDAFGVPEHFAPLVNKIMKEGKLLKESDRVQTYKHPTRKDIDLEYELDTGSVGVRFDTDQGMKADYYLKKSPPDEMNPRGGPDEFIEGEIKYTMGEGDTYYKGFEEGIDTGTSNLDEFVGMPKKSASGAKVKLPESLDDYASGGIARMLGE
jgi:hypothetical protein